MENPEGWGGYSLLQKTENPGRRGVLSKIPSVVGVWIFSGTTHYFFYLGLLKVYTYILLLAMPIDARGSEWSYQKLGSCKISPESQS